MAVLSFPKNGGSYNLLTNVAPPALACLGACTYNTTRQMDGCIPSDWLMTNIPAIWIHATRQMAR
jgi:hypothetical protein